MSSLKSSEKLLSREDLHSDMDLIVERTWSLLHVALPQIEQQDIDLDEYVVVETSTCDFFDDPFLLSLALDREMIDKP